MSEALQPERNAAQKTRELTLVILTWATYALAVLSLLRFSIINSHEDYVSDLSKLGFDSLMNIHKSILIIHTIALVIFSVVTCKLIQGRKLKKAMFVSLGFGIVFWLFGTMQASFCGC